MNFNMGNSGRHGFHDEEEQQQQQGKHIHHHQYPCFNSTSTNYGEHHHRGWLDRHGGGGGGPNSDLELSVMDTSMAHDDHESSNMRGGGGGGGGGSGGQLVEVEREHMFDKVVTPSDVGKLNRLVIPKQHAERYFPLDSSTNEKGLLLNFEDRNGKPWRFRYSYWNSSQSYVMTKGWSRFVKENKLDAGDIVSFQRGVGDLGKDRLFIDWRRRPDAPPPHHPQPFPHHLNYSFFQRSTPSSPSPSSLNMMNNIIHHQHPNSMVPWNPIFLQNQRGGGGGGGGYGLGQNTTGPTPPNYNYGYNTTTTTTASTPCQGSVVYFRSAPQQQLMQVQIQQRGISSGQLQLQPPPVVFESVPVVHGKTAAKRLRLFGVNMDCPITSSDSQPSPTNTNAPYDHHYNTTSSSSTIPYLQLTPNSNPTPSSSSDKVKVSMSLDLDI